MLGVHTAALVLLGRFSHTLYISYSVVYGVATYLGLTFIPVIGRAPLDNMEHMGPLFVFCAIQILEVFQLYQSRLKTEDEKNAAWRKFLTYVAGAFVFAFFLFIYSGKVGPISVRVRSLFVKHTRTGNPLVDSVAEHQATPNDIYWKYFHVLCLFMPFGLAMSLYVAFFDNNSEKKTEKAKSAEAKAANFWFESSPKSNAAIFLFLLTVISYYFSSKMIRLVLMLCVTVHYPFAFNTLKFVLNSCNSSIGAACAGGVAIAEILSWAVEKLSR
jgi:dolichyl-diphosphooligosaccharide---protein glycosyltransferase